MEKVSFLDKLSKVKNKKKRISVYISPDLIKKLKIYAAEKDTTISETVESLLETKLHGDLSPK